MTAIGTPRMCIVVPHEWRASCTRILCTPAAFVSLCHIRVSESGEYGAPDSLTATYPLSKCAAESQPFLGVACRCAPEHADQPVFERQRPT
jgi:hypothetical protein